jgi:PmbA protein
VTARGQPRPRDRGELLLAPPVAARLLAGLLPLLVGEPRRGSPRLRRAPAWARRAVTVIDNGRLPGGAFEAPVDGEGVPTREVVLVERGVFRQPLLAWWQEGAAVGEPSGCSLRPGWRDLPAPGPTHLYIRPDPRAPVASLLGDIRSGYYLLDATGAPRFDFEADRFTMPVCGFAVQGGRAAAPVARVRLCGGIGVLLRGIVAVGRDLTFQPLGGMIGAPTLLARGLELVGE